MMDRPAETVELHTRLMKAALEIENSRAYWQNVGGAAPDRMARRAFDEHWFGARSLLRIERLMQDFRARYDAFPSSLQVLSRWANMDPDTRRLVCHWHLQLADPLYRAFTGTYLVSRHDGIRAEVTRDLVVKWVGQQAPDRWQLPTQIKFASRLLTASYSAGLITSNRDPRPLRFPRVGDTALTYILYLLREVQFAGTLLDNPYLASVGLQVSLVEQRLRTLPALRFRRQGDLVDFGWQYPNLAAWASAKVLAAPPALAGGTR
jgi:hypothetical protein